MDFGIRGEENNNPGFMEEPFTAPQKRKLLVGVM